jgi:replication fork clamp-binding protein CrfC
MCGEANMIESTLLITTTAATIFAALAAWFSYMVSKKTLEFQKNYSKNQNLLNELNSTVNEARSLKLIMFSDAAESNEEITSLIIKLKSNLQHLSVTGIIDYQALKLSSVENVYELARDNESLTEVIEELEKKYNEVFK